MTCWAITLVVLVFVALWLIFSSGDDDHNEKMREYYRSKGFDWDRRVEILGVRFIPPLIGDEEDEEDW